MISEFLLGVALLEQGELDQARIHFNRTITLATEIGDFRDAWWLGMVALRKGELSQARDIARNTMTLACRPDRYFFKGAVIISLEIWAMIYAKERKFISPLKCNAKLILPARFIGAALELREKLPTTQIPCIENEARWASFMAQLT